MCVLCFSQPVSFNAVSSMLSFPDFAENHLATWACTVYSQPSNDSVTE